MSARSKAEEAAVAGQPVAQVDEEGTAPGSALALDRAVHAGMARLTLGLSPASVASACMDWWLHLAVSPGKQMELVASGARKAARLAAHAGTCWLGEREPCIEPLPQDRRFRGPGWQHWPFNLIYQAFLLNQQWWHKAATDVCGVNRHHEQMVDFSIRQWLDRYSPSNFLLTNPEALSRAVMSGGTSLLQGTANFAEDLQRLASQQPPAGTERYRPGRDVALTPGRVVFRNHLIELIQYAPATPTVHAEPMLVVPSWIMKYYILDLSQRNSLVRYLVEHGHTVFLVSWRNPDAGDRELGMDEYLRLGVMAALRQVQQIVPGQPVHGVGYCLGGTLLAIAAARLNRQGDRALASLSLLASQVDFTEPGELALFIDESQLAYLDDLMYAQGYLDGKQMAGAFALLNQRDLVFSRMVRHYLLGEREEVSDLAAWNADATRMPFRQHHEYLQSLYHHNDLAQGRFRVEGEPVALSDLRLPLFCLATERDTVSPWHSVYKISLLTDAEVTFCLTTGGHNVGVVNPPGPGVERGYRLGTRAAEGPYVDPDQWFAATGLHRGSWWPAWLRWLHGRSGPQVAPPPLTRGVGAAPGRYVLMP